MFKIGDEVVIGNKSEKLGFIPLTHNSQFSPEHDCRGKILAVGRKYYKVQSTGAPIKILINPTTDYSFTAWEINEAKELYRQSLVKYRGGRTDAFIEKCVNGL